MPVQVEKLCKCRMAGPRGGGGAEASPGGSPPFGESRVPGSPYRPPLPGFGSWAAAPHQPASLSATVQRAGQTATAAPVSPGWPPRVRGLWGLLGLTERLLLAPLAGHLLRLLFPAASRPSCWQKFLAILAWREAGGMFPAWPGAGYVGHLSAISVRLGGTERGHVDSAHRPRPGSRLCHSPGRPQPRTVGIPLSQHWGEVRKNNPPPAPLPYGVGQSHCTNWAAPPHTFPAKETGDPAIPTPTM